MRNEQQIEFTFPDLKLHMEIENVSCTLYEQWKPLIQSPTGHENFAGVRGRDGVDRVGSNFNTGLDNLVMSEQIIISQLHF